MMKATTRAAAVLLACLMAACAALAPPESADQRIAYAYGVHTAVLNAAATAVEFGDLSADQGQHVLDIADRAALILAGSRRALAAGDIESAEGQLALALAVLSELQAYLRRVGT